MQHDDVVRVAILVIVIRARERVEEVEVLCAQILYEFQTRCLIKEKG